jgi:WhiB family transcriptional regulator, redox-sensing transcriptional regulator
MTSAHAVPRWRAKPSAPDEGPWHLDARCRGVPVETFFPDGGRGRALHRREAAAKAVCVGCPVMRGCLQHAIATPEKYGIWGGLTARERDALAGDAS